MKRIFSVYRAYYINKNRSGAEFLRDAVNYIDARNESMNDGKTPFKLLIDFCTRVEMLGHTRV